MAKVLHVLALGLWFGGAAFFNFAVAPAIFASFKDVVYAGPSDRTAGREIIPPTAIPKDKDDLASALAGAAVGPVFPLYFGMQAVCGGLALATAVAWWNAGGAVHRRRVIVLAAGLVTVAVGWVVSDYVRELRLRRYESEAVGTAFVRWHFVSLGLSVVTVGLAGVGLALTAWLPQDRAMERG